MSELKFKYEYDITRAVESTSSCIRSSVEGSPDYHAGAVESLESRVAKLTEIVAQLIALSPEEVQKEIVETHYWGYKAVEVKDE